MSRLHSYEADGLSAAAADGGAMTTATTDTTDAHDEASTTPRVLRLAAILDEEGSLYEKMAGVSLSIRESLIRSGIDSLRETVREQEDIIERIDGLERERAEVVAALTSQLGGGPHPMTIGEIVAVSRAPEREKLRAVRERVLSEVHRMQKISETNSYLIGNSLEVVAGELALFADRDDVAYDRAGENVSGAAKTRILDRRA